MKFIPAIPFVEHLGLELLHCDGGEAEVGMAVQAAFSNSFGVVHGGVTMSLLDVAMAQAARSPNQPGHAESPAVVTIEMKTSFMRPGAGRLLAHGRVLHRTASLAFCEASVRDAAGQLVAQATGTFKYLRGLAVRKRSAAPPDAPETQLSQ